MGNIYYLGAFFKEKNSKLQIQNEVENKYLFRMKKKKKSSQF